MNFSLQAGPFAIDLAWMREGRPRGRKILHRFEPGGIPLERLKVKISPSSAEFDPIAGESKLLEREWAVERLADGGTRVLFWCGLLEEFSLEMRLRPDYTEAEIRSLSRNPNHNHLGFLLTAAMRWLVLHRLALRDGFLLHGAGLQLPSGRAIVATGHSGAGKSTLSSFFKRVSGGEVLSDETVAVLYREGRWAFWGTPWPGMLGITANREAPIHKILFLEKTPKHELLAAEKPFYRIWSEVFVPPFDSELAERVVERVEMLLRTYPPEVLCFEKKKSVVSFLEARV